MNSSQIQNTMEIYSETPSIKLHSEVKFFNPSMFKKLLNTHAINIAKSLSKDTKPILNAIKTKDTEILNEYVPGIDIDFIEEPIFTFHSYKNNELVLGVTSGLMAKAIQRNILYDDLYCPLLVQGVLITRDNKIVLGVRNKPDFRKDLNDEPYDHKIMFCPAGYATYNENIDITESYFKELEEELGINKRYVNNISIIGHFKDIGFTGGVKLVILTNIKLNFDRVVEKWETADHCWEYEEVFSIKNDITSIKNPFTEDFFTDSKYAKGVIWPTVFPILKYLHDQKC